MDNSTATVSLYRKLHDVNCTRDTLDNLTDILNKMLYFFKTVNSKASQSIRKLTEFYRI
jgi:hypothetical protein